MSAMDVEKMRDAIHEGAPVYNKGGHAKCLEIYLAAARNLQQDLDGKESLLDAAIIEASELQAAKKYSNGAWVLRHCFDDILANERERIRLAEAMPTRGFGTMGPISGKPGFGYTRRCRGMEKTCCPTATSSPKRSGLESGFINITSQSSE